MSNHRIQSIETIIVDLPLSRVQRFAAVGADSTAVVLVRIKTKDGILGLGEACTPSGPWWGGESVESIKLMIDMYIQPLLIDTDPFDLRGTFTKINRQLFGNNFAKAAVEMSLLDIQGKAAGLPVSDLLGGKQRSSLNCSWPLATGNVGAEIDEAIDRFEAGQFNTFKFKMGFLHPDKDVERVVQVSAQLPEEINLRVDPNESWDEATCKWAIPRLEDAGIEVIEQPIPRQLLEGSARISLRSTSAIMLDESVCTEKDALNAAIHRAGDIVSLKPLKSGGLMASRRIADISMAAGLSVYMGTFLESSIGTAANMQLAASLEELPFGGELSGPQLLAEDLSQTPARYENFELQLEDGHGIACNIDEDKLQAFRRDRNYSQHQLAAI